MSFRDLMAVVRFGRFALHGRLEDWPRYEWAHQIALFIDNHRIGTMEHVLRCGDMMAEFGVSVHWKICEIEEAIFAAAVHDLGKLAVAKAVIDKPGPLTLEERIAMQEHAYWSRRMLTWVPGFGRVARIVGQHHECWDGTGYPLGLERTEILTTARALSVMDAYDAMVNVRVYRGTRSPKEALQELRRCSGTQFDPEMVEAFIKSQNGPAIAGPETRD